MNRAVAILLLFLALAAPGSVFASASAEQQLSFLRSKFDLSHNQISSIKYSFSYDIQKTYVPGNGLDLSRRTKMLTGQVVVRRQGQFLHVSKKGKSYFPARVQDDSAQMVVNDSCTAVWHTPTRLVFQFDHLGPRQDPPDVQSLRAPLLLADLLSYGYGFGESLPLFEPLAAPPGYALSVKSEFTSDGVEMFRVRTDGEGQLARAEYLIDPSHGFLIIEAHIFNRNGVVDEIKITPRKIEPRDLWIPGKVDEVLVIPSERRITTIIANDVEIDPKWSPDEFSISSMNLPEGALVSRKFGNGTHEMYSVMHHQLVPHEVATALKAEEHRINMLGSIPSLKPGALSPLILRSHALPYGIVVLITSSAFVLILFGVSSLRRSSRRRST